MSSRSEGNAAPARPPRAGPSPRTRAFLDAALVLLLLATAAVRLRIHLLSPLPSEDPLRWFAAGFLEDAAAAGAVTALLLAAAGRVFPERWARPMFSIFAVVFLSAEVVWSEVVIFFGQIPLLGVLRTGMNTTFLRGAAQGPAVASGLASILVFSILLGLTALVVRNRTHGWSSARRLFAAAGAALVLALIPLRVHRRETARHPFVTLVKMWAEGEAKDTSAALAAAAPRDPLAIRNLAPDHPPREYPDQRFPLAHLPPPRSAKAPRIPAGVRPNFVFFLMEGIRAEEVGAYGDHPHGLTPNLDRLAWEGILIERAYSPGMHTPDAELAFWYGLLPDPRAPLMTSSPQTRLTGLPEILRAAGWRSLVWIHNGDQTFYRRDRFYLPRGFRMVDGRDFPASDPRTNWGYSDRALARRAVRALDGTAEPFAAMIVTVSNHHPFQVPDDATSRLSGLTGDPRSQTVRMLHTIHYTDEAVGDFFRRAETRPWFPRTVFVIGGDHGLSVPPSGKTRVTLSELTELRHRVPLILFSKMLEPAKVSATASQADLPETLLALAGIASPRTGMGRDLLDPEQDDPARKVLTWSSEGSLVSVIDDRRTYHASVPDGVSPGARDVRLAEEILLDPGADPEGRHNLFQAEPRTAAADRDDARLYLDIYPWLLLSGRSGLPQVPAAGPATSPHPDSLSDGRERGSRRAGR